MKKLNSFITIILLIINGTSFPQWSNDSTINTPICIFFGNQTLSNLVSDGNGGAIIVWEDYRGSSLDIYAQRINSAGEPQWAADGIPICTAPAEQRYAEVVSDGNGGAIIVWIDKRNGFADIYAQKVSSDGIVQWIVDGVAVFVAANSKDGATLITDLSGGAIITWSDNRSGTYKIYAQRILSDGSLQWSPTGVPICVNGGEQVFPAIAGDGFGGALIAWQDYRSSPRVYVQNINSNGQVQWATDGVSVCNNAGQQQVPSIVSDSFGNAIIVWRDKRSLYNDLYAQSVNSSGLLNWNVDGIPISIATGEQWVQNVISDGFGGAIVTWRDHRGSSEDIYTQKINSSGTTLWSNDGLAVCTAANDQMQPDIIATSDGGAIITWDDSRFSYNPDIYAQKINGSGITEWANNGIKISANSKMQSDSKIIGDGNNGAIIAWNDNRNNNGDIYAQQVNQDGSLGVVSDISPEFTGIAEYKLQQNYPNPFNPSTTITYHLPKASSVRLKVYDIIGNEIATLVDEEKSAGIYKVNFSSTNLASGVYLYKLQAGGFVETRKMILVR